MEINYIYKVLNKQNYHWYVGYTNNPKRRWNDHKSAANRENSRFYNALRKYGKDQFEFYVLEELPSAEEAKYRERELIAEFSPEYNTTSGGDGLCNPPDEVRKKMSEGIRNSPKAKMRMVKAWETRKANTTPEELSRKCSEVQANLTPEQKAEKSRKLSEAQAARTAEEEAERQRKRAETVANWTPEQKAAYSAKITEHNLTRVLTEEAQQRIAEGQVTGGHLTGQIMKERLAAMSEEEKAARMNNIVAGIKKAAASRTQEQKDEITRKRLESRARNKAAKEALQSQ